MSKKKKELETIELKPENITVKEVGEDIKITYKEVFTLMYLDEVNAFDLIYFNDKYDIKQVENLVQRVLEHIQGNPGGQV